MGDQLKLNIYIDGNNLYRGAKELGYLVDYKKFRNWLRQKYQATNAYLFIGLVPDRVKFYEYLQESGFILVFKQTISVSGVVKGNCDAESVYSSQGTATSVVLSNFSPLIQFCLASWRPTKGNALSC